MEGQHTLLPVSPFPIRREPMATQVAALVKSAQEDSALREALVSDPDQVARDRHLPVLVARSAACALGIAALGLAALGVWF
jgi:hypothetical protein